MSSRSPSRSAIRSNSAMLSESAQCRSSKTTTAGAAARSAAAGCAGRCAGARPGCGTSRSSSVELGLVDAASRPSKADSSSSNGRPSEPGSACPTSTTVVRRQHREQLLHQPGLADARLAGEQRHPGVGRGDELRQPAQLVLTPDHHRAGPVDGPPAARSRGALSHTKSVPTGVTSTCLWPGTPQGPATNELLPQST